MKTIADVMTRDVSCVSPEDSIRQAAELMDDLDVGALPVTDGQRLVGMITDRDITIRATAAGLGPEETQVADVMTDAGETVKALAPLLGTLGYGDREKLRASVAVIARMRDDLVFDAAPAARDFGYAPRVFSPTAAMFDAPQPSSGAP